MDKDSFAQWLDSPATEVFLKYLKDMAKEEATYIADAILNGDIVPLDDQIRVSTLSMTLIQISEISFQEIESFYKK